MQYMQTNEPRRFPWIPLLAWILLFVLVVFSASLQSKADLNLRLGMILFWGIALTAFLTVWLFRRQSSSPAIADDELSSVPRASDVSVPADPNWVAALEREAWFELLQTMGEESKLDRLIRIVPPQIQQLFPESSVGIYVRDAQETLNLYFKYGDHFVGPASLLMSECEAMSRGQMVEEAVGPDGLHCACTHHTDPQTLFVACIPIITDDHYLGLLSLYHPLGRLDVAGVSRTGILQKGQTFASALGLYLQTLKLKEMLDQQVIRDPWTGLFNRRYMEETLFREFAEAARRRTTIGVIMVYPDQINEIRTTYGAKASDQIIWEIGQRLPRYIRTEDIPCRHDEDMFCVILPGAAFEIILQRAEKVRMELGGLNILFHSQPLSTTVSVGVAMFPQHSTTVHGLVAMAEMAVRNSQRQGGNRVALPPQGNAVNW